MNRRAYFLSLIILSLILSISGAAYSDESSSDEVIVPELRAVRINPGAPMIDGDLTDNVWKNEEIEFYPWRHLLFSSQSQFFHFQRRIHLK